MTTKEPQRNHHGGTGGHDPDQDNRIERQQPRRNPRLVIGTLDFFDMLMEQDEQG